VLTCQSWDGSVGKRSSSRFSGSMRKRQTRKQLVPRQRQSVEQQIKAIGQKWPLNTLAGWNSEAESSDGHRYPSSVKDQDLEDE
jgi:hypothetical protein